MTRAKKNIFWQRFALTVCLWQCIMPIVKSLGYNSLTANLPDNAGELRGCEARTAPNERHNSPALSGFFVRSAQKGRCVVESLQAENKLEETRELTRGLAAAAVEAAKGLEKTKIVMLASINFLLGASPDLLDDDIIQELKHTQKWLTKEVSEGGVSMSDKLMVSAEEPESEADAVIEEAIAAPKGLDAAIVASIVKEIEEVLDRTTPEGQVEVMQILADRQPERFAEYKAEMARDDARDNLLDYLLDLSLPAQMRFYKLFRIAAEDKGEGILTDAA